MQIESMQIETDEFINGKDSNIGENSNMSDNSSRQVPTRNHKETCMLAYKKNCLVLHSKYY